MWDERIFKKTGMRRLQGTPEVKGHVRETQQLRNKLENHTHTHTHTSCTHRHTFPTHTSVKVRAGTHTKVSNSQLKEEIGVEAKGYHDNRKPGAEGLRTSLMWNTYF